jgi:uncharacterized protein (DUF2236 family)
MMNSLRRRLAGEIVALFNDPARDERPIIRRADGLLGSDSVAWRVHGDVVSMMAGGVSGLLLQMLHPRVLAGVWDHSDFRKDLTGRLRRTARFIAVTTYGGREEAGAAITRVRAIHGHVRGTLPDGTPYAADDPELLAWVHVTETVSFLGAWRRLVEPRLSRVDQDRYVAEMAEIGRRLGADPVPESLGEAHALIAAMRPQLGVDARTREVAGLILNPPPLAPALRPFQRLTLDAGVDLLPDWARRMHAQPPPALTRPGGRAATMALAGVVRWAFARPA